MRMSKKILIVSILVSLILVLLHQLQGGLYIELERSVLRNSEIGGSLVDATDPIWFGGYAFLITLLLAFIGKLYVWSYIFNLLILYFAVWLASLDVSVVGSVEHGDYVLALLLVTFHIPVFSAVVSGYKGKFRLKYAGTK